MRGRMAQITRRADRAPVLRRRMRELTSAALPPVGPDDHIRGEGPEAIVYLDLACPRCALAWTRIRELRLRLVVPPLSRSRPSIRGRRRSTPPPRRRALSTRRRFGRWWIRSSTTRGGWTTPSVGPGAPARPRPGALQPRAPLRAGRRARSPRLRGRDPSRGHRDAGGVRRGAGRDEFPNGARPSPRGLALAAASVRSSPLENESSEQDWPSTGRPEGKDIYESV